jgi:hypothetical protein
MPKGIFEEEIKLSGFQPKFRVRSERDNTWWEMKLLHQTFAGVIKLCNELTHYNDYTVASNIAVTLEAHPVIGGSAEIRMIGDGSHSPTFTPFVKSASSADFDSTLNAINKVIFYYDGTDAFYSITVL